MPKNKVKNIIVNSFTAVAIMIYQQKFLRTAVGSSQAGIVAASLLIRLVVNTLNSFLIVPGTSDVQLTILKVVAKWNGWFAFALSILMQVVSTFKLGERRGKAKYFFLVPLFIAIVVLVTLTPLNVVITDIVLFVTGFSQVFTGNSHSVSQDLTVMVY